MFRKNVLPHNLFRKKKKKTAKNFSRLPGSVKWAPPPLKSYAHAFRTPHPRRSRSKCGFCSSFAKCLEQKPHFGPLRRGWGVRKACADEFYPIFDHFWPFWRILCSLLHFRENTVILGAPIGRSQMGDRGYLDPNRTHRHTIECIFVSRKLLAVRI